MAGENNNEGGASSGDARGLNGVQPTTADLISQFKGASAEDGVIKSVQDGVTPLADPDPDLDPDEDVIDKPTPAQAAAAAALLAKNGPVVPAAAPKAKSAQERINQAVRAQRTAERLLAESNAENKNLADRMARLEGRLDGTIAPPLLKGAAAATTAVDPAAPVAASYKFGDLDPRYIADLAKHEATKVIEADKTQRETARQTEERKTVQAAFAETKAKFSALGVAKYPDFQESVMDTAAQGTWDCSQTVGELALESEVGPEILYYLATNVDESKTIAKMTPAKQAAWFGKMEAAITPITPAKSTAAAKGTIIPVARQTLAPTPPERRVAGRGNVNPVQPDTQDFAAFERLAKSANGRH